MSTLTEYLGLGVFAEDQPARWESEYVVEVPAGQDDLSNYVTLNLWNSGNNLANYGYMSSQGFTTNYNGWYIDDTDIFDFGAEDFTVRLQFGFGSYYAYNELEGQSTIPVLCMGPGQVYDSPFLVAMVNPGTPNYVQQGDLFFSLKDTNDNEAYCYLSSSDWYLPTYASKFHMEISRRGSLFSLRYNGLYGQKEVNNTFASFGSLDISGMTRSYIMSSSITGSVNNGFYALQITKGISRTVGPNCIGEYTKTFGYPSQPMIKRRHSEDLMCKNLVVPVLGLRATPPALSVVDDTGECAKSEIASGNVLTNDSGEYLRVTKVSGSVNNVGVVVAGSAGGVFTIGARGEWTFDPDGDFDSLTGAQTATTSVTYHVSDGTAEDEGMLTVTVGAASASTPWTPAEITTALWLDAADATTITNVSGKCSQWANKSSGSSVLFTQGSDSARPSIGTDVLEFSGAQYLLADNAAADWTWVQNSQCTLYFVGKPGVVADPNALYVMMATSVTVTSPGGVYLGHDTRDSGGIASDSPVFIGGSGSVRTIASSPGAWPANTRSICRVKHDPANSIAANHAHIAVDGGNDVSNNTNSGTQWASGTRHQLAIGAGKNSSNVWSFHLIGDVCEALILSGLVDNTTDDIIVGYLAHKWGLAASLPSGHPYKSAPPTI